MHGYVVIISRLLANEKEAAYWDCKFCMRVRAPMHVVGRRLHNIDSPPVSVEPRRVSSIVFKLFSFGLSVWSPVYGSLITAILPLASKTMHTVNVKRPTSKMFVAGL